MDETCWMEGKRATLNNMAVEIHKNAVAHGWWDGPRSFPEIIALVHSELSEALEEYRDDMPMLWFRCNATEEGEAFVCDGDHSPCKQGFVTENETNPCIYMNPKPEGIAVELADAIIRILDYCGQADIDIDTAIRLKHEYNKTRPYRHGGKTC